jgi:hypothetical protein
MKTLLNFLKNTVIRGFFVLLPLVLLAVLLDGMPEMEGSEG